MSITDSLHIDQTLQDYDSIAPKQDSLQYESVHHYIPKDTVTFTPKYIYGLAKSCPAPVTNPITDYKEATLIIPKGIAGTPRPASLGTNNGITLILTISFLLVATSFRSGVRLVSQMLSSLFSIKESDNSFSGITMTESRLRFFLQILTLILEGIILAFLIQINQPQQEPETSLIHAGIAIGCTSIYYFLQFLVYHLLGSIFTDYNNKTKWINGYVSINSLLGIFLFPVVFVMIYIPHLSSDALWIAVVLYIFSRIIFIYKSIKIFLRDIYGILYFILYLCALEITPLILLFKGTVTLYNII